MNRDAADAPVVSAVEATAYTIPTDQPEADGTIAWDDTTIVVVRVHADGVVGTGWTYGSAAIAPLVEQTLAPVVTGTNALANVATWSRLVRALRNVGRPGVAGMGLSAVDCALWDLKARLLALPLHRLLGADRDQVPLYGSGGFTTYGRDRLERQLRGWVEDAGMRAVKIKIGESWGTRVDRDLDRVRQARDVIGPDVELFVDANGGYTVGQAVRVGRTLDALDVRWFEEPVSSDDLAGLRTVRRGVLADVTAGEYGFTLDDFHSLCEADALDCLQVDVTRCGGITELLRVAALAASTHLEVSGHCAPHQHAPVMAAVPNLRHLEYFHDHVRIERMFFDGAPDPVDGALPLPAELPGNGLSFRPERAAHYRAG
ncbi:MAG: enolase C-terminal domain-like protein [Ornithinibacter sp.]